jgi:hypothetical protein
LLEPPKARRKVWNGFSLRIYKGNNLENKWILEFWPPKA